MDCLVDATCSIAPSWRNSQLVVRVVAVMLPKALHAVVLVLSELIVRLTESRCIAPVILSKASHTITLV